MHLSQFSQVTCGKRELQRHLDQIPVAECYWIFCLKLLTISAVRCNSQPGSFVYKSLHGLTIATCPTIANSDVGRRQLRSSDVFICVVPRTQTGFSYRTFQVVGPKLWNSFTVSLRQSNMAIREFKSLLKVHLFA